MSREQILWSPGHPNLIDVQLTVSNADGETLDEVQSYTGLRSTGYKEGGRFLLNGRPYYLRMVLDQGYWPQTRIRGAERRGTSSRRFTCQRARFSTAFEYAGR